MDNARQQRYLFLPDLDERERAFTLFNMTNALLLNRIKA